MCWSSVKGVDKVIHRADEDIVVYKLVRKRKGDFYESFFRGFKYFIGETCRMHKELKMDYWGSIEEGVSFIQR